MMHVTYLLKDNANHGNLNVISHNHKIFSPTSAQGHLSPRECSFIRRMLYDYTAWPRNIW